MSDAMLKCWAYPGGSFEGHAVRWSPQARALAGAPRRGASAGAARLEAAAAAAAAENRSRSARRSRNAVRRLVRASGMDTLGTLTVGGERVPEASELLDMASDWYRRYGSALAGHSPAVFVVEAGGEFGRLHVHFSARKGRDRWDYDALRGSWTAYLVRRGYHSPTGQHRVHVKTVPSRRLGRYLGKYIVKAFGSDVLPAGAHRYRAIGGVSAPVPSFAGVFPDFDAALGALGLSREDCYALERLDSEGVARLVGYAFDVGG